ncbi:MAG: arylsulfatase [Anaerolineae bacterium]|nr:arylsulfatase [Anaerolineae bacterium]
MVLQYLSTSFIRDLKGASWVSKKPNVVFVLTDDQGYGELGCHGNRIIDTPNMDALHGESIRLTDYHVGPTCAPTRAGLITGHYHNSTGVWHTIGGRSLLRQDEYSIATAFSENGYRTGLFGKWHLGDNTPYRPQDRGFQHVVTHGGGGVGNTPDYWGNNYNDDVYAVDGQWTPFTGYCTDIWFERALEFIEQAQDEPFLCFITTNAPHSPYIVDDAYSDPYLGRVETRDRANFYGMITCIDENLGLLRRRLRALGLDKDTILIFMTDNGTSGGASTGEGQFVTAGFNAGMRGIKGSEYEGGHRVPLFIHWPGGGLDTGRDVPQLAANVDMMPTLLDLCGIDARDHLFDGKSLVPLFDGRETAWPDRIIVTDSQRVAYPVKWRKSATMTQRWRLINGVELYDILADPGQKHDVAARHPDVVNHMRQGYEAWWKKVSQQFDGTIPIPIGHHDGETVLLNSHDWRNDPVACAWNQSLVRAGLECNGYWEIDVATPGCYRFELRRWPKEQDSAIAEGIPGELIPYSNIKNGYGGGRAIPLVAARIAVAGHTESQDIAPGDKRVVFEMSLDAGETRLQTALCDAHGNEIGAYYVYATRLSQAKI